MNKPDKIKLVYEMLRHEHVRWNHWAIFFLGSIASIFLIGEKSNLNEFVPNFVLTGLSAITSFFWILSALAIKKSTHAWTKVIRDLESNVEKEEYQVFDKFIEYSNKVSPFEIGFRFRSVTNMLLLFGILAFLFFLIITFLLICKEFQCG